MPGCTIYTHASITMKMHSMVHMPRLILEYVLAIYVYSAYLILKCRFGPLINHWTTRFEAKHKYFKHYANIMGNFKNVCYSLAMRHQLKQCYNSLNTHSLPGDQLEIGISFVLAYDNFAQVSLRVITPYLRFCFHVTKHKILPVTILHTKYNYHNIFFRANWVELNGTKYQTPCIVVVGCENDELIFGDVTKILVQKELSSTLSKLSIVIIIMTMHDSAAPS